MQFIHLYSGPSSKHFMQKTTIFTKTRSPGLRYFGQFEPKSPGKPLPLVVSSWDRNDMPLFRNNFRCYTNSEGLPKFHHQYLKQKFEIKDDGYWTFVCGTFVEWWVFEILEIINFQFAHHFSTNILSKGSTGPIRPTNPYSTNQL